jgi:hypothetical protein
LSSRYALPSMISRPQSSKRPVKVEFIGIMPTLFAHCQHCTDVMHGTGMQPYSKEFEEYPDDVLKQYFELSEMAEKLRDESHGYILFDAMDAASPLGVWKTVRHRIFRTPCVLIQGTKAFDWLRKYVELREKILGAFGSGYQSHRGVYGSDLCRVRQCEHEVHYVWKRFSPESGNYM